jgi:hypothetical protein
MKGLQLGKVLLCGKARSLQEKQKGLGWGKGLGCMLQAPGGGGRARGAGEAQVGAPVAECATVSAT